MIMQILKLIIFLTFQFVKSPNLLISHKQYLLLDVGWRPSPSLCSVKVELTSLTNPFALASKPYSSLDPKQST